MNEKGMDRRTFLKMAAVGTAALTIPGCKQPVSGKKPNVLFVFDDQLRADVCGMYGGRDITTPHIDRLAGQGVTFTNSISSCPLCTPYRGMVQTGRYPTHSGIIMNFVEANQTKIHRKMASLFWMAEGGGAVRTESTGHPSLQRKESRNRVCGPGSGPLGVRTLTGIQFPHRIQ